MKNQGEHITPSALIKKLPQAVLQLCTQIASKGGNTWLVGGSVRDLLLGRHPNDFDLEVFNMESEQLHHALKAIGHVISVGKQFGVFKLLFAGHTFDIAMPRTEYKNSRGHTGFSVHIDPQLSPEKATARRDFTINAMMLNPLKNKLIDLHGGHRDLRRRQLRHVSPAFAEDPLRPLRAMQFAARFRLTIHPETAHLCHQLLPEASSLPLERIWNEWQKWSLSDYPEYGLKLLKKSGWIACYPELLALNSCPQDPRWHPEGDVWKHTCLACKAAAHIATRNVCSDDERMLLLFATLCHDLGKPKTTIKQKDGRISSRGHATTGVIESTSFLKRIGAPRTMIKSLLPLVEEHMQHLHHAPTAQTIRRLAHRLEPAHIEMWEMLTEADASGRALAAANRPALDWLTLAHTMKHHRQKPQPFMTGRMLLQLGCSPGPEMGEILHQAYEAQLDGLIHDHASAIAWYYRHTL